jgi:hypothetical protein
VCHRQCSHESMKVFKHKFHKPATLCLRSETDALAR